jgi:hypothetical protein
VYALNLVNEIFETEKPEFYHHYQIVNIADTEKQLEGLEFVFVELPKFKPEKISEKKLQVLWLRFLTEIDEKSTIIPEDLLESSEIREAVENLQSSAFSKAEMESYDKYWDSVRTERTLQSGFFNKGKNLGRAEEKIANAINGIKAGLSNKIIKTLTELSDEKIDALREAMKNHKP